MLDVPAPFPFTGSRAFLRVSGTPVRILRRNPDSTALVELLPQRAWHVRNRDASGNRTVDLADLAETEDEALAPPAPRINRPSRRATREHRPRKARRAPAGAAK